MGFLREMFGSSRMTDHQYETAKSNASDSNETAQLARLANGFGATRVQQEAAKRELVAKEGEAGAKRAMDNAVRSAGRR